jgi:hypothetical protein
MLRKEKPKQKEIRINFKAIFYNTSFSTSLKGIMNSRAFKEIRS